MRQSRLETAFALSETRQAREGWEHLADGGPDGSRGGFAQQMFELGEDLLDGAAGLALHTSLSPSLGRHNSVVASIAPLCRTGLWLSQAREQWRAPRRDDLCGVNSVSWRRPWSGIGEDFRWIRQKSFGDLSVLEAHAIPVQCRSCPAIHGRFPCDSRYRSSRR